MIDTHVHLEDKRFTSVEKIIESFPQEGIERVINASVDLAGMQRGLDLAERYTAVYCTIGTHPHEARFFDREMEQQMMKAASHPKVVAVGEIGLDYYYNYSEPSVQKEVFVRQLQLADEFCLPVVIHLRDAYGDAAELLDKNRALLRQGGVFHCYSGSKESALRFLPQGFYFSFGGPVTFKNWAQREVVEAIPNSRLLCETDCPYLTPEPYRGKVNEPKNVKYVIEKLAEIKQVSFQEMDKQCSDNAKTIFNKLK